jgi:hypothetical protein
VPQRVLQEGEEENLLIPDEFIRHSDFHVESGEASGTELRRLATRQQPFIACKIDTLRISFMRHRRNL